MSNLPDAYKEVIIGAVVDDLRRFKPIGWFSMYGDGEVNGKRVKKPTWLRSQKVKAMLWLHKKSAPYADCCGGYPGDDW